MPTATLQTPLEVILFFTSLASHGVKPQSFQTISQLLRADQDVREGDGFDESRLSPESLQQLYLALLKDEIRNQAERRKSPSPAGQEKGSPNSRKRKLSSPALQSLEDAQEHEHLIPTLVDNLYARYRAQTLQEIEKEEETFRSLQADVAKLGQNAPKERVNGEDPSKHTRTPSISSLLRDDEPKPNSSPSTSRPASAQASAVDLNALPKEPQKSVVGLPSALSTPHPGTPGADAYKKQDASLSSSRPPSSGAAQRPYSPYDSNSRSVSSSQQDVARPLLPPMPAQLPTPSQGYSARVPGPISVPTSSHSRPQTQSPSLQMERASQSPVVLPPPTGPGRGYPSPTVPMQSPQIRQAPPMPSPVQVQQHHAQHPHTVPRSGQYAQQGFPYQNQRQGYPPYGQYPQQAQSYQNSPLQMPQYGAHPPYQHAGIQQGQLPGQANPYQSHGTSSGAAPYVSTSQHPLQPHTRPSQATPVPSTAQRRVLPRIDTSTPSTKWKKSTGPRRDKTPPPPPLSPMDMGSPSFLPKEAESDEITTKGSSRRGGRPALSSSHGTPFDPDDTPSRPAGRGRGGRGTRGGRGGFGTPSTAARTRSQSVNSQTEDQTTTKKASNRKVKPEPDTPMDENPPSVPDSSAGTPLPLSTRRRRDTLRSIETPPVIRPGQKRKRANTLEVGSPISPGPTTPRFPQAPTRPGYVLGVRNLPRIAATMLNDVTTHKLASMFQKPISAREAPGYKDVVFQPQDLKTIRSQMQAGQKAIIAADAAAQESGDVSTPSGTTGVSKANSTIWLERSADVLPPRAIVNSSQLETEICRIFANAVMFNPDAKRGIGPAFRTRAKRTEALREGKDLDEEDEGEDDGEDTSGVVSDAREMFRDVERQLAGWRAAERTNFVENGTGTDGAGDEDHPMTDAATADEEKDDAATTEGDDGRSTRRRKA